jgi:hypothetical protein
MYNLFDRARDLWQREKKPPTPSSTLADANFSLLLRHKERGG